MSASKTNTMPHSEESMQHQTMLIAAIALGGFLSLYNSVALNVAIPTFVKVFDTSLSMVQWIMISYTLMMGVLSPTAGYFADKFSCRNLFSFSMLGFAVVSLISGFCNNIFMMIGVRLIQGALAAFIIPCSMMIIYQFVPFKQRATFLTLQSVAMSSGPAIGPVFSGVLLTWVNWHWVFWVNVPVALFTAWAVYKGVPYEVRSSENKLDYLSFVYVIVGTVLFLLSFNQVSSWGIGSPAVWAMMIAGAVLVSLFVRRCLQSSHPVLNFKVLGSRDFSLALLINSCISMALCLVPFVLAIYFQDILGYTPMMYGLILLIPAFFSIGGGPLAQWLYSRVDSKKIILVAMLLLAGGSLMLSRTTLKTTLFVVIFWLCSRYLGIGLSSMPITDYGMSALSRELSGHGTSLINWFKMMATSLSLSIFTMVLDLRIVHHSKTMDMMNAQMMAIGDVFFYSGLILVVCVILSFALKSNQNLE